MDEWKKGLHYWFYIHSNKTASYILTILVQLVGKTLQQGLINEPFIDIDLLSNKDLLTFNKQFINS